MIYDIIFFTHANNRIGFGHASRCAQLCRILKSIDESLSIAFVGVFADGSKELLKQLCDPVILGDAQGLIGIYDRMDDPEFPHIWSSSKMEQLKRACRKVIFFANGTCKPKLPRGVACIGYKPGVPETYAKDFYWGLSFAPVHKDAENDANHVRRDHSRVFVALGGGATATSTMKVINACKLNNKNHHVDVLLSPVNKIDLKALETTQFSDVEFHKNVPDLTHFFKAAGLVVASYGHLAYEAMAYGSPICLVGQKQFQTEYAKKLEEKRLCVSAGILDKLTEVQLAKAIESAQKMSNDLSLNTAAIFDGGGFNRIAEVIYNQYSGVK